MTSAEAPASGPEDRAADAAVHALESQPQSAAAHHFAGEALLRAGRRGHALVCLDKALRLEPQRAEFRWTLAEALREAGRIGEAVEQVERCVAAQPQRRDWVQRLGALHYAQGRYEDALACFDQVRRGGAADPQLLMSLAMALHSLRRMEQAEPYFAQALQAEPANPSFRWEYAMQQLLLQRFDSGWDNYEVRHALHGARALHVYPFPWPLWRGEPLAGRTLVVHGEQGLGDEIMYASIVPELLREAGRCVVACAPSLRELFANSFRGAEVVSHPRGDPDRWLAHPPECLRQIGAADYQIPIGSLAHLRRRSGAAFADARAYLAADGARAAAFRATLDARAPARPRLRVGLVWSGNLRTGLMGSRKSIPIRMLAPLAGLAGVQWVSLQQADYGGDAALVPELAIADFSRELRDFSDTAALIDNLDLVISVDTSVAHLAGALGRTTWVPLWWAADWRWGWAAPRSYWYRDVHLLRQRRAGDWLPVIDEIRTRLEEKLRAR